MRCRSKYSKCNFVNLTENITPVAAAVVAVVVVVVAVVGAVVVAVVVAIVVENLFVSWENLSFALRSDFSVGIRSRKNSVLGSGNVRAS